MIALQVVATHTGEVAWDSGVVTSNSTLGIKCSTALRSATAYTLTVGVPLEHIQGSHAQLRRHTLMYATTHPRKARRKHAHITSTHIRMVCIQP